MIPGYNHNIKHQGKVYHVQTEDSGTKNPHIITHLFVGGNILASTKTKYDHLLGQGDYVEAVKDMMQAQHKEMLKGLIGGKYDAVQTGTAYHLDGPAPLNVEAGQMSESHGARDVSEAPPAPEPEPPAPEPITFGGVHLDPNETTDPAFSPRQVLSQAPWSGIQTNPGSPAPAPPAPTQSAEDAAFVAAAASPFIRQKKKVEQAPEPQPLQAAPADLWAPAAKKSAPPQPDPQPATDSENLPPEVLAARRLAAEDLPLEIPARGDTIFGEDLVSEKSLDEVILSYLSDDSD
jgi:hypothetical protein